MIVVLHGGCGGVRINADYLTRAAPLKDECKRQQKAPTIDTYLNDSFDRLGNDEIGEQIRLEEAGSAASIKLDAIDGRGYLLP